MTKTLGNCDFCKRQLRIVDGKRMECDGECAEGRRAIRAFKTLSKAMERKEK